MNRRIVDNSIEALDVMPGSPSEGADTKRRVSAAEELPVSERELGGKLAGLPIWKQAIVLSIWPFIEQVLNFLVGMTDTMLAGRLGEQAESALAALGAAAYLMWLMGLLSMAIGVGAGAVISRAIGARRKALANASTAQSMILAAGWGVVIGVLVFVSARGLGSFVGLEGESLEMCTTYLQLIAFSAPAAALMFVGNACMRAAGHTGWPLAVMTTVNVVNVVASVAMVKASEPIGGHGVTGIALGTVLAWVVGAVLVVTRLSIKGLDVRLRMRWMRPHGHTMKRIVKVGLPNLSESIGQWAGNFVVVKFVGALGVAAMSTHLLGIRIEAISYLPGVAIGTAAATLTGQYLGLGDPHRAKLAARWCWLLGVISMGLAGGMFMLIPHALVKLTAPDAENIWEDAATILFICGPAQIFFATYIVLSHSLRGAGATRSAMVMTYATTWLVRVPLVYIVGVMIYGTVVAVWAALCFEFIVRGAGMMYLHFRGKWTEAEV